jgi:hypothetical protein
MMSGAWVDGTWAAVVDETPVDVLMHDEEGVLGVDVSPARLSLLSLLLCNAVGGRPGLGVMGARMWWMLGVLCPGLGLAGVKLSRGDRALVGGCCGLDLAGAAEVELVDRWRVGELVRGDAGGLMELGRRVSLLAYMLERGPVVREALPCMESIGLLWGLRATNKRSAICAAMMKIQGDMDKCGMRLTMREPAVLWFQKARSARVSYEVVQRGNHNRKGGVKVDEEEDEEAVRVREEVRVLTDEVYEMVGRIRVRAEPVPMKAEFQGLSPGQLRLRLDALHEAAERRRLGV